MIPLVVLIAVFAVGLLLRRFGARYFQSWVTCLRVALAAMFLVTASAHFTPMRSDLVSMVPPSFSDPELMVTLTGIAELAGAVGLLIPRTAPWAAMCLAILMVAMFPANMHAANAGLSIRDTPAMPVVPRLVLQVVFIAAVLVAGFAPRWFGARTIVQRHGAQSRA